MVSELFSGAGLGAKGEALFARDLGSNCVEVADSDRISTLKDLFMILPKSNNHEVVGQGPGDGSKRSDLLGPWRKEESKLGHAEGASLWDAAWVVVGEAESSSKRVVIQALLMKAVVCSEGPCGEPR